MRVSILWQMLSVAICSLFLAVGGEFYPWLRGLSFLLFSGFSFFIVYRIRSLGKQLMSVGTAGLEVKQGRTPVRDELGDIVDVYNGVAGRAEDLFSQIAEKIGIEKEVQTAEIVQSLFFPSKNFSHSNLRLAGKVLTATQCAGDWWHYDRVGDHLILGVGDATGHGVAAALMMAAVHGAYSISVRRSEKTFQSSGEVPLSPILEYLNEGCRSVSGGENTMTFIGSTVDLKKGIITVANASHPSPYLLRRVPGKKEMDVKELFRPLKSPTANPLGASKEFSVESKDYQLQPGDIVIWYTDGLMIYSETRPAGSQDRLSVLRLIAKVADEYFPDPAKICEKVLEKYLEKRSVIPENLMDDVTIVVATVPLDAKLEPA